MLLRLGELLDEERIRVPLLARDPRGVIEELVGLLPECRNRALREEVQKQVLEREALESTAIGNGVAFPHGMAPVGSRVLVALGIAHEPMEFESFDGAPVEIVLLIVGSEENRRAQLRVLSRASTLLHEERFRRALAGAASAAEALNVIRTAEETD